jgi:hypothetical protein
MTIQYIVGDCLNDAPCFKKKIICHVNNDIGGWGSGFVVNLSKRWKKPEEAYRKWHKFAHYSLGESTIAFKLGNVQPVAVEAGTIVINMIAQHNTITTDPGSKPIRYAALVSCMSKAAAIAKKLDGEFHCPMFGAGLAGGNWDFIEELINEIWADFPVYIYKFEQK